MFYHEEEKEEPESENDILESSVVSSNSVEFYKTIDLENISKQAIPDNCFHIHKKCKRLLLNYLKKGSLYITIQSLNPHKQYLY